MSLPSFPVFFMTQPMYSMSYVTIETKQPINRERTLKYPLTTDSG